MSDRKEKYPSFVTPMVILQYPFLQNARDYKGNGNFAYDTAALLGGAEAAELEKFVNEQINEACAKFKSRKKTAPPFDVFLDEDGKETDLTKFKFKVPAITITKRGNWDRRPAILDQTGTPIPDGVLLGNGTKAQISFEVYQWSSPNGVGVTLQPKAIMVHELVEYTGGSNGSAESFGFETKEDGFTFGPGSPQESSADGEPAPAGDGTDF